MHPISTHDHVYYQTEQVLSGLAAVPLLSWLFLPMFDSALGRERRSSNSTFHFSRVYRGDSLSTAMSRHQHMLFSQLNLRPKKTVLALFCGNGTTCEQLIQFSDVNVVGIDTDAHLILQAKINADRIGLAGRVTYHHAQDVCEALANFPDCSFDAVFAIEPSFRIASPATLYKIVGRLLKPSGRFAMHEWCFTDAMATMNVNHAAAVENLVGSFPNTAQIGSVSPIAELVSTLGTAGLANVSATDLALRERDVPWYSLLESHQTSQSKSTLCFAWWYDQLSIEALLTAARLRIFSPMVLVTAEKGGQPL